MFIKECTLYNYTDDNCLSCTSPMIDHVISNLQLDGNRAIKWFTDNGMQANPDKFKFLIIPSDDNNTQSLTLNENTVIVSEKHVKVLGVVIDCRLNFTLHISSGYKKADRQLNALARISNYLDVSARRMIYNSFVASNFNYCPHVWHFCGVSNSNKMEKIQEERCLRIVYKDYDSSYDRLLEMANTTSLSFQDFESFCLGYTNPYTTWIRSVYQWSVWSKTYELLFEKPRKIGTTNETDIDLWPTISLIYWCKIVEWFIPSFKQWCRDWRF